MAIKFRAWNKEYKEWVDPDAVCVFGTGMVMDASGYPELWGEDDSLIVGRFTGLKDKNGKEIYEGDIVKTPVFDNAQEIKYGEIEKSDDATAPGVGFQLNDEPENMEVIGNIYENPELLEAK